MKISTLRGLLLLAGVALAVAKLAGLIDWPWLAVVVPLLAWGYPWIAGLAALTIHLLLGLVVVCGIMIMGEVALRQDRREARRLQAERRQDIADGRVDAGLWDA